MPPIGIMQGRLTPPDGGPFQAFPRDSWEDEFGLAQAAGLDCIEWIDDVHGEGANPLETDEGIGRLRDLAEGTGVDVRSVCADWFMARPLTRGSADEIASASTGSSGSSDAASSPISGGSCCRSSTTPRSAAADEEERLVEALDAALPHAETREVELHLETDLAPERFAALLDRLRPSSRPRELRLGQQRVPRIPPRGGARGVRRARRQRAHQGPGRGRRHGPARARATPTSPRCSRACGGPATTATSSSRSPAARTATSSGGRARTAPRSSAAHGGRLMDLGLAGQRDGRRRVLPRHRPRDRAGAPGRGCARRAHRPRRAVA